MPELFNTAPFQVFETNIRMVGGLLSGFHVTGERRLLELATDLANRLLPAFTTSPTGIPYRFINLRTGAVSNPETNLAETGTYIAEFGFLSQLTGDRRYYNAAKRALQTTFDRRTPLDLLPFAIHAETGQFLRGMRCRIATACCPRASTTPRSRPPAGGTSFGPSSPTRRSCSG